MACCHVSILRDHIRPRHPYEGYRSLAKFEVKIFNTTTVTAHIKREEIIAVYVLSPIISLATPELGVRLALEEIARLHERLANSELVAAGSARRRSKIFGIRRIGLNQKLAPEPRLVGVVIRIHPIIDKDQFRVCHRSISQPVFGLSPRRFECNLLAASAV